MHTHTETMTLTNVARSKNIKTGLCSVFMFLETPASGWLCSLEKILCTCKQSLVSLRCSSYTNDNSNWRAQCWPSQWWSSFRILDQFPDLPTPKEDYPGYGPYPIFPGFLQQSLDPGSHYQSLDNPGKPWMVGNTA